MADSGTITTVASIISGFGVAMLFFRIQRELHMDERKEQIWIPWADWLLVAATLISLLAVLLPLVMLPGSSAALKIAIAACGASIVLVAGYVFAILAHYRLLWGKGRSGPRDNPEPAERALVYVTVLISTMCFVIILL